MAAMLEVGTEWQNDAACLELDLEFFFPDAKDHAQQRAAKEVCDACPVVDKCLEYALDRRERYGVWGGMTEDERGVVLRNRRRRALRDSRRHG